MELWNDFEGKTVAGRFPLERLLGPQGRSAFFATTASGGGAAVIRLIETHFDEEEILARWRVVMGLTEPNLQALTVCGDTTLEGTKLVYAVLEATDMELSDALRERPLTAAETRQVGAAVLGALEALHGAGLVHEHVEAANVLAKGDAVKLRSDCVRGIPEEGAEAARAADVRGLALLLAECLTQARDGSRAATLPAPFAEMVRRGASGEWGLAEMRGALDGPVLVRPGFGGGAAADATGSSAANPVVSSATGSAASFATNSAAASFRPAVAVAGAAATTSRDAVARVVAAPATRGLAPAAAAAVAAEPVPAAEDSGAVGAVSEQHTPAAVAARFGPAVEPRSGTTLGRTEAAAGQRFGSPGAASVAGADRIVLEPVETEGRRTGLWAGLGFAAVVVFGSLAWHMTHRAPAAGAPAPAAASAPATAGSAETGVAVPAPAPAAHRAPTAAARSEVPAGHGGWRVVAFTYKREDQARHKAQQLAARHAGLRPEVWSPSGHAPWLVALGGWMDEREAATVVSRAKRDGLPRDTFARNYRR